MKTKQFRLMVSLCCILMGLGIIGRLSFAELALPVWNPASILAEEEVDHAAGKFINIVDEKGNLISQACRGVAIGDEIINSEGKHYRVVKLDKDKATVKSLGVDKRFLAWHEFYTDERLATAAATPKKGAVGVYHTHSDEAYVPSDGTESIPFNGGIYDVGKVFAERLQEKSAGDIIYDKTPHDPHDNAAYQRSRRTAANIMQQNPIAMIDVHRDGIPDPNYYSAKVSDTDVSKLRLVVGRQNPNMEANLDFAKRMMAYSNKIHPEIVKEIFMAKGNYNQDLLPTALLIEAGTHTNTKEQAENGVALFADAVPVVLGIEGGPTTPAPPGGGVTSDGGTGGWKAVGWIIGLTLLLGGGYFLISTGSLKGLADLGKEFTNYLGPLKKIGTKRSASKTKDQPEKATDAVDKPVIDRRDDVTED